MFQIIFHLFRVVLDAAKLLDGQFCHLVFIISDFLDKHVKIFDTSPVFCDSFCLIDLEIFQGAYIIRQIKFFKTRTMFPFFEAFQELDRKRLISCTYSQPRISVP